MNALVKKEIRLLLPGCLAVLLLEVLQPWFWQEPDLTFGFAPIFFFLGMVILAVDSFGREFSLGTFQSLLSQPVERRQIWRIKITVFLLASVLIFAAYFISCGLRLHLAVTDVNSIWHINPRIIRNDFRDSMIFSVLAMLVALTGGLWTSLLLRQTAAAFWITLLAPVGSMFFFTLAWNALGIPKVFHPGSYLLLFSVASGYCIASFWFAHRLFRRAQDTAWTGGIVNFSTWRYFEAGSPSSTSTRHRKPVAALVKKEFQLQSISWFCAAALLALHIAVILMRKAHGGFGPNSLAGTVSEFYWALWLVMPLIIGCTTVAEDQRLGMMEGQFCLPASRRLQFVLKFSLTIISGLLLGGFMPLLMEGTAAMVGAPNPDLHLSNPDGFGYAPPITIVSLALGLSLAGFFASTFTKIFLQAMGIAFVTIIGCCLFTIFAGNFHSFLGVTWHPGLTIGIAILTTLVMAPSLAYGNFKYFQERGRMWRRNVLGLSGAILFIFVSSAALHNRAWEVLQPAEPAHGPAKFSLANPPVIQSDRFDNLLVRLPDGRVWFDRIGHHVSQHFLRDMIRTTLNPFPTSIGPRQFVSGSNWVSYVVRHIDIWPDPGTHITGYLNTVGIQSDGTLWVSDKSRSQIWTEDKLTRFGDETDWRALSWSYPVSSVLLLKKDGTLWRWGTNQYNWKEWQTNWPALSSFNPYRIGTNSDWKDISFNNTYLQKTNGTVWSISVNPKNGKDRISRDTNFDQVDVQTMSQHWGYEINACVHKDGTLWISYSTPRNAPNYPIFKAFQYGKETNWISVAASWDIAGTVGLKSDGTLWQLDYNYGARIDAPTITRLGIHNDWVAIADWVAIGQEQCGVVSLAADGSLWLWPYRKLYEYRQPLLKLPKQPQFLGNVFGKAD